MQGTVCVMDHQVILVNNSVQPNNSNNGSGTLQSPSNVVSPSSLTTDLGDEQCFIHFAQKDIVVTELRKW